MPKQPSEQSNDISRLNALKRMRIMDSPPEERFDYLTRVARGIFDVPIALISFVDDERQWFKSCQGLDFSQTKKEDAFCYRVVIEKKPLIIEDASQDDRFKESPLVTKDGIRFYAGIPLCDAEGEIVGSFAIKSFKPRSFSEEDRSLLKELALTAQNELTGQLERISPEIENNLSQSTTPLIHNFFALRKLHPLRMLTDTELMLVARVARAQTFAPGHLIADNQEAVTRLFIQTEGSFVNEDGMELHSVIGVVSLLLNQPPAYNVHAGPNGVKCILLLKAQYFTLINACPKLMRSFIEMINFGNK